MGNGVRGKGVHVEEEVRLLAAESEEPKDLRVVADLIPVLVTEHADVFPLLREAVVEEFETHRDAEAHGEVLVADLSRVVDLGTRRPVEDLADALKLANSTDYGLTAAIHTRSVDRAMWFAQRVRAGVVNINIGTFGSEPHMPFGGFGASGNGTREPGVEALDVYSELKNISFLVRDTLI